MEDQTGDAAGPAGHGRRDALARCRRMGGKRVPGASAALRSAGPRRSPLVLAYAPRLLVPKIHTRTRSHRLRAWPRIGRSSRAAIMAALSRAGVRAQTQLLEGRRQ